jgi:hypothetical protein
MVQTFYLDTLYRAIELILLFWLLGLLFKWVLTLVFGEKGAKIIGFLGYTVNFALKRFFMSKVFKIEVYESDPFRLKFEYEKTDRWDILFTSFVVIPLGIGLILGSLVGTLGLLVSNNLIILSVFLYILGFLIAVNSIPTFQDVRDLKNSSVRSIVIWFVLATILCAVLAAVLTPFINSLGILIAIPVGILGTTCITFFIPAISEKLEQKESTSLIGGTVDLDG